MKGSRGANLVAMDLTCTKSFPTSIVSESVSADWRSVDPPNEISQSGLQNEI